MTSPHFLAMKFFKVSFQRAAAFHRVATHEVGAVAECRFFRSSSLKQEEARKKPEKGFLFSAPCLDPEVRSAVENQATNSGKQERGVLFSAPCLDPDVRSAVQEEAVAPKPAKREKGVLFSAPCLDPEVRNAAQQSKPKSGHKEKGLLFSAPCLDMDRDGTPVSKVPSRDFSSMLKTSSGYHPESLGCNMRGF